MKKKDTGSGLLDAVAATALGLVMAHTATDTVDAIRILAAVDVRERLLVETRNILESYLGAPCATLAPCPSNLQCRVDIEQITAGPPPIVRVRVTVSTEAGDDTEASLALTGVTAGVCT